MMKFFGGFIAGVIATVLVLVGIYYSNQNDEAVDDDGTIPGMVLFAENGECITRRELTVVQTLSPNMALARFGEPLDRTFVLLVNYDGKAYYDNQKIQIPSGMCATHKGTYQYETSVGQRTVPVVVIN